MTTIWERFRELVELNIRETEPVERKVGRTLDSSVNQENVEKACSSHVGLATDLAIFSDKIGYNRCRR